MAAVPFSETLPSLRAKQPSVISDQTVLQYVAIPSGWGGWLEGFAPGLLGGSRGNSLFVFALP
jgi:hypothetical protein